MNVPNAIQRRRQQLEYKNLIGIKEMTETRITEIVPAWKIFIQPTSTKINNIPRQRSSFPNININNPKQMTSKQRNVRWLQLTAGWPINWIVLKNNKNTTIKPQFYN